MSGAREVLAFSRELEQLIQTEVANDMHALRTVSKDALEKRQGNIQGLERAIAKIAELREEWLTPPEMKATDLR